VDACGAAGLHALDLLGQVVAPVVLIGRLPIAVEGDGGFLSGRPARAHAGLLAGRDLDLETIGAVGRERRRDQQLGEVLAANAISPKLPKSNGPTRYRQELHRLSLR
jgi:hypothetical protein